MPRQEANRIDRHIFKLKGDDVARRGKGGEARFVVPRRLAVMGRHLGRDAGRVGGIDMSLVAELRRREAKHPAELAAAEDADRRTGWQQGGQPSRTGTGATLLVCVSRHASSFCARSGSLVASSAAANRPALVAPGFPIAKVATGMPPGIWTIE